LQRIAEEGFKTMNDHIVFLREFLARFEETGSAVPSSRWAAQALTRPIKKLPHPKQILEVAQEQVL